MAFRTDLQIEQDFNRLLSNIENYFCGRPLSVGVRGISAQIEALSPDLTDKQLDELYCFVCDFGPRPIFIDIQLIPETWMTDKFLDMYKSLGVMVVR